MPDERNYYCICEDNCKFPTMTSEQILAAIAEATGNTVTNVDDAFITKLKEMNVGGNLTVWIGTEREYAAIAVAENLVPNRLYITTDDTWGDDVEADIEQLQTQMQTVCDLTAVTEWTPINKYNVHNAMETIGYYKTFGSMVMVTLNYLPTNFSTYNSTTLSDTITLPFNVDVPTGYAIPFPANLRRGDGVTDTLVHCAVTVGANTVTSYGVSSTLLQGFSTSFIVPKGV